MHMGLAGPARANQGSSLRPLTKPTCTWDNLWCILQGVQGTCRMPLQLWAPLCLGHVAQAEGRNAGYTFYMQAFDSKCSDKNKIGKWV